MMFAFLQLPYARFASRHYSSLRFKNIFPPFNLMGGCNNKIRKDKITIKDAGKRCLKIVFEFSNLLLFFCFTKVF